MCYTNSPSCEYRKVLKMASIFLFSIAFFFFFLGYTTLIHFKLSETQRPFLPIKEILIPWPRQGRLVSIICVALSTFFVFLSFSTYDVQWHFDLNSLKILLVFVIIPMCFYLIYILQHIKKIDKSTVFITSQKSGVSWQAPILASVVISLLYFLNS